MYRWRLILAMLILSALSLTTLGSISAQYLVQQMLFLLFSSLFFYLAWQTPVSSHKYLKNIYAISSFIFLLLPFFFGVVTRGTVSWIQIGSFSLQPSEVIKPFLIAIYATILTNKPANKRQFFHYLLSLIIPAGIIFIQPDLGSALVVCAIWFGMLLASSLPKIYPVSLILIGMILAPVGINLLQPYQKARLETFVDPYKDPKKSGYQVIQATIAVGSGGFWGKGLGQGSQSQLQFLPERHTDFIFSSFAEEMGFIGSSILVIAYGWLLSIIYSAAKLTDDQFSRLIMLGIFSLFFFQGLVNIGMNLGLMPVTGVTLPLISSGGSSLLSSFIALGMVQNILGEKRHSRPLEIGKI